MKFVVVRKKRLFYIVIASLALIALISCFMMMRDNVLGVFMNNDRKLPIYCVGTEEKKIAISFDAAWGAS